MTTLIAIVAEQGKLNLDAPVLSFFPDRTIANRDARKERVTVRHLANMANGMESVCFANDEGTLNEMTASPDWVQFALDCKMTSEPGYTFCYDSPGMHLLSAILQKATGMTTLEFARQNLFGPLGIRDVIWLTDPQGYTHGWSDLYLHPRDVAKLGYLWLNKGTWQVASEMLAHIRGCFAIQHFASFEQWNRGICTIPFPRDHLISPEEGPHVAMVRQ